MLKLSREMCYVYLLCCYLNDWLCHVWKVGAAFSQKNQGKEYRWGFEVGESACPPSGLLGDRVGRLRPGLQQSWGSCCSIGFWESKPAEREVPPELMGAGVVVCCGDAVLVYPPEVPTPRAPTLPATSHIPFPKCESMNWDDFMWLMASCALW